MNTAPMVGRIGECGWSIHGCECAACVPKRVRRTFLRVAKRRDERAWKKFERNA